MLTFDQALDIVLNTTRLLGTEETKLADALGRILAEDVKADTDIPPFNKAAMDGYACRRQDIANELTVIETIPAGRKPQKKIGPNQCAKIMTGAVVPDGADCVIMKEYVQVLSKSTIRFIAGHTAKNICRKGEDAKAGRTILYKGTLLKPQHLAVLASVGHIRPLVAKRPRIAVIATGDELVDPAEEPSPAQIRNSNSFQLTAQLASLGLSANNYGIAKDTTENINDMLKSARKGNDLIIITGGVSLGQYDLVKQVLKQNRFELLFEKVAIKPGRPVVFAVSEKNFCFGLPGNPVSCFVLFELMLKPFLYRLMGHDYKPPLSCRVLDNTIRRKKTDRDAWLPVAFVGTDRVRQIEYHGSAHINALCRADGLICIPAGKAEIERTNTVVVRHI